MNYVVHVRDVHAHAECLRCTQYIKGVVGVIISAVNLIAGLRIHPRVEEVNALLRYVLCEHTHLHQTFAQIFCHLFALSLTSAEEQHPTPMCINLVLLDVVHYHRHTIFGLVSHFLKLQTNVSAHRVIAFVFFLAPQTFHGDFRIHLLIHHVGHRGGKHGNAEFAFQRFRKFLASREHVQIFWAKLHAPLRDAVRLIKDNIFQSAI